MMRRHPNPQVAQFLDSVADDGLHVSAITVWEVLNGIGRLDSPPRRRNLAARFEDVLNEIFENRILEWTAADARECARIMEEKRRRGEPLDKHLPDAMLGGTAVGRDLVVVTRNTRDFHNTGVEVVDPWMYGFD